MKEEISIFEEYYTETAFQDRFLEQNEDGIDVIIPVYHTNELWRTNLFSIYREVPVKRLLISDGGCIDDSIEIVKDFPRVEVFDHRDSISLGWCIAKLIKAVETEHFIYLHSDVFLPKNWYDKMIPYKKDYDWYGCPMNITVMVRYHYDMPGRPYAGSQIGKKAAFEKGIDKVGDDYVYRQEDFVFNRIVEDAGFRTGKVEDTFHFHQLMYRTTKGYDLNINSVKVQTNTSPEEKRRALMTQIKGIVKYLDFREPYVVRNFISCSEIIFREKEYSFKDIKQWIKETNPKWLKFYNLKFYFRVYALCLVDFVIPKYEIKLVKKLT